MLNKKIEKIEVTSEFSLDKIKYDQKLAVVDIIAEVNEEELLDMEMQERYQKHYIQRVLIYAGNLLSNQLEKSEEYDKFKNVVAINIVDFTMFSDITDVHTIWKFREDNNLTHKPLKGVEIHIIELTKFRKSNPNLDEKLSQWLTLIDTKNKEWLEVAMEKNENVKNAMNKAKDFVSRDQTKYIIAARKRWQLDQNSLIAEAKESGIKKGLKKGIKLSKSEIAKELLKLNIDINDIVKATGLSKDFVYKLKEEIK